MGDELTPEDRKLLSEVKIKLENVNEKLGELKLVLFREHMDGFLYKFAGLEPGIKTIPDLSRKVEEALKESQEATEQLNILSPKVETHDKYILKQTITRTLIIIGVSGFTSAVITLLTIWSTINTIIGQLKGKVP